VVFSCALFGQAAAQNVLGIDFGSEFIKLAVVQRSAGVQVCCDMCDYKTVVLVNNYIHLSET
jgi:hypothetical protein